ncbi:type I 3-dehydroquinate dehydratase [Thermoproteota archaeon]
MSKICVTIRAETQKQTLEEIKAAKAGDIIEVRLDYRKESLNLKALRMSTEKPFIATNRRADQGGLASEPEHERVKLLIEATEAGFNYIDIASTTTDLKNIIEGIKKKGSSVILSHHDYKNSLNLSQLESKHNELAMLGPDIIKIIGWTNNYSDNLPYLEYNNKHPGNISFGMGEHGTISRVLAPLTGALYTYASSQLGKELAPGQVPLAELRETYRRIL